MAERRPINPEGRIHPYDLSSATTSRSSITPRSETPPVRVLPASNPASSNPQIRLPATPPHPLQGILDKILAGVNANAVAMSAMQQELQRQSDLLEESLRSSFSIESSGYKNELLRETSILFCKTVSRLPDQKSILGAVGKVLKAEACKKYKRCAAETFVKTRLGELRAEERRRVFGKKPCQGFLHLRCEEFARRFLSVLKVDHEEIGIYHLHIALLRKFCRTEATSEAKTYKGFDAWLQQSFQAGQPSLADLQTALDEEDAIVAPLESAIGIFSATPPPPSPADRDGDDTGS